MSQIITFCWAASLSLPRSSLVLKRLNMKFSQQKRQNRAINEACTVFCGSRGGIVAVYNVINFQKSNHGTLYGWRQCLHNEVSWAVEFQIIKNNLVATVRKDDKYKTQLLQTERKGESGKSFEMFILLPKANQQTFFVQLYIVSSPESHYSVSFRRHCCIAAHLHFSISPQIQAAL